MTMILHFPIVKCIDEKDSGELKSILETNKFQVFEIGGLDVNNQESFFRSIVNKLPLDPPLSGKVHYDAFTDSLWGGLSELEVSNVAIIWNHTGSILNGNLNDLLKILQCFDQVKREIECLDYGIPKPMRLLVFLMGNGVNFSKLSKMY
jgi:RNAse (barnase) inhibitor barstar